MKVTQRSEIIIPQQWKDTLSWKLGWRVKMSRWSPAVLEITDLGRNFIPPCEGQWDLFRVLSMKLSPYTRPLGLALIFG